MSKLYDTHKNTISHTGVEQSELLLMLGSYTKVEEGNTDWNRKSNYMIQIAERSNRFILFKSLIVDLF